MGFSGRRFLKMDDITFYKSLYDRELKRRIDLDNSISVPIGTITLLFGLIFYVFSNVSLIPVGWDILIYILIGGSGVLLFIGILYLVMSYNYLIYGFKYQNFPSTLELREYQLGVNKHREFEKIEIDLFDEYLINKYVDYTNCHVKINDKRGENLYHAKSYIIASMLMLLLTITIFLIIKN